MAPEWISCWLLLNIQRLPRFPLVFDHFVHGMIAIVSRTRIVTYTFHHRSVSRLSHTFHSMSCRPVIAAADIRYLHSSHFHITKPSKSNQATLMQIVIIPEKQPLLGNLTLGPVPVQIALKRTERIILRPLRTICLSGNVERYVDLMSNFSCSCQKLRHYVVSALNIKLEIDVCCSDRR